MLFVLGILLGHFLPGAMVSRLILRRVDLPLSFIVSSLSIALVLSLLNIFKLSATLSGVACALAGIACAAWAGAWALSRLSLSMRSSMDWRRLRLRRLGRVVRGSPLAAACALGVVAIILVFVFKSYRAPLPGYDMPIRWEYIASRAFEQGNFHFYPPVSREHFYLYCFPDAMGLMVPGGYWWAYVLAGRSDVSLGIPVVVFELLMILIAGWQFSRALGAGAVTSCLAVFLLAATGVVTTNVLIGQETGFLVLCALVILTLLFRIKAGRQSAMAGCIMIGLAAAAAALTREYGLAYLFVGVLGATWAGASKSARLAMAAACLACAGPWLFYVWLLTGNPFYTLGFLGLLPKQPALFVAGMEGYVRFVWENLATRLLNQTAWVCLFQSLPALAGAFVLWRVKRARVVSGGFVALIAGLCVWGYFASMGDTYYSFRVIAPAAAVLALICAIGISRQMRRKWWMVSLVAILCVHALLSVAIRFDYPFRSLSVWPGQLAETSRGDRVNMEQALVRSFVENNIDRFKSRTILTSDAYVHRALAGLPVKVLPLWSPGMEFLVSSEVDPLEVQRMLKEDACGDYLLVNQTWYADMFILVNSPWFKARNGMLYPRVQVSPDIEVMAIPTVEKR